MTSAHLPGVFGSGWADYGKLTPAEIIEKAREHARHMHKLATAVLAAADEDFCVETYVGVWARKKREVIQAGRPTAPTSAIIDGEGER
jgi:hypothetical protein